jgi:hypothetical protein
VNLIQSVSACVDVANSEMSLANAIDVNAISDVSQSRFVERTESAYLFRL